MKPWREIEISDREPGWGDSLIDYNLSDLLQKAESR
jgi:hypothetical protein